MEIFSELLILLFVARLFGEIAERVGQPSSAGEIISGIVLALVILMFGDEVSFLRHLPESEVLSMVANVGIFALVLLAGIEMEPDEIAKHSKSYMAVAAGGMVVPLLGGMALAWWFLPASEQKQAQVMITGIAFSISAIPVSVKILSDLGLMHSPVGRTIIAAALFDDIYGLFLLAIVLALIETGEIPDPTAFALLIGKVTAFFAITMVLGTHVYPKVSKHLKTMQAAALEFSALAAVAIAYGWLAEGLGIHWILGAFMAGLYFERSRVGVRAYQEIRLFFEVATRGFLGPIFFLSIGLGVSLSAISEVPLFLVLVIFIAFFGKLIGAAIPSLMTGLSKKEAMAVGIGMNARGAVELIVLSIALKAGVFDHVSGDGPVVSNLYSVLVLMGVVTTILSPMLLRRIISRFEPD